jgi:mannosyltransferase OCH1-like enzyme
MISKIIHYVWFGKQKPIKIQNYINTWHNKLSDYEIIEWNEKNFDINSVEWVKQAVEAKKWAFIADYIRLWVLYNYGGIYLDTDVECLKSFDAILLNLPYFLGREHSKGIIGVAVLGAEPKCEWIKDCLGYYKNRNFILPNGEFSIEPMPHIMLKILGEKYGLKKIKNAHEYDKNSKKIQILPTQFFSPKSWDNEKFAITKNTYTVHYFEKSWEPPKKWYSSILSKIKFCARKIIGDKKYSDFMWFLYARKFE